MEFVDQFTKATAAAGSAVDACHEQLMMDFLPLQNVVSNVRLGPAIDPRKFTYRRPYAHVPARFGAAAVMHFVYGDQTTILVFNSGCVVVVGSKSQEQTIHEIHRLRYTLNQDGIATGISDLEFVNMVYSMRVSGVPAIDVAAISKAYMKDAIWRPKMFPGLRLNYDNALLRIFDTNQVVIMGANRPRKLRDLRVFIRRLSVQHHRGPNPPPNKRWQDRIDRQNAVLNIAPTAPAWLPKL
jgi:TATA-box binding protein (TBP) (component of TFIID and TFIIIB)